MYKQYGKRRLYETIVPIKVKYTKIIVIVCILKSIVLRAIHQIYVLNNSGVVKSISVLV